MRVTVLAPALGEILAALEYYEDHASGLARALDEDLARSMEFVRANPRFGSLFQHDTRRVLLRRFPYALIYRALSDEIVVVAFAHQKGRPGYWAGRV